MAMNAAGTGDPETRILESPGGATLARQLWATQRSWMETQNLVTRRYGGRRKQHWYALLAMMKAVEWTLRGCGQFERGLRNAQAIVLRERVLTFPDLPVAFDGFTILHISDPHFDGMPGIEDRIAALVCGRVFDLCIFTGDYRTELHGPLRGFMAQLARLLSGLRSRLGFLGILGNHDDCHMVAPMERMGIRMLINERIVLERGADRLQLIGTDDVHYYYTDESLHALAAARDAFSIALVHSPELFEAASEAGAALYLCGHTHGGQIRLPGGFAPLKHLRTGRHLYSGYWQHRQMQGITNCGAGTSGIPVRFNTQGEVLALELRRSLESYKGPRP